MEKFLNQMFKDHFEVSDRVEEIAVKFAVLFPLALAVCTLLHLGLLPAVSMVACVLHRELKLAALYRLIRIKCTNDSVVRLARIATVTMGVLVFSGHAASWAQNPTIMAKTAKQAAVIQVQAYAEQHPDKHYTIFDIAYSDNGRTCTVQVQED